MRTVESSQWPHARLMVSTFWRDGAHGWTICPPYSAAYRSRYHPHMVLGVQCSTLNIQTMMRGFANHLGKLAQKAVFVAALARLTLASARGRVKRCRHELTQLLGAK